MEKIAKIGKWAVLKILGKKGTWCERGECPDGVREKVYCCFCIVLLKKLTGGLVNVAAACPMSNNMVK